MPTKFANGGSATGREQSSNVSKCEAFLGHPMRPVDEIVRTSVQSLIDNGHVKPAAVAAAATK